MDLKGWGSSGVSIDIKGGRGSSVVSKEKREVMWGVHGPKGG
jgi:hypothetical protein